MELREKSKSRMSSSSAPPPYNALPNKQPASGHPSSLASLIPSSNATDGGGNATDVILATSFIHPQTLVQNHLHQDQFHLLPQPQRSNSDPDPNHPSSHLVTAETSAARYRECLRNHAASIGGHVMDGCGEFMPGGEEGTPEALKCAACDCHRNFHRKVVGDPPNHSNYHYPHDHSNPNRNNSRIRRNDKMQPPLSPPPPRPHHHHQIQPYQHPPGYPHARPFSRSTMMTFGGEGGPAESSSEDLILYQEVHQHSLQHAHPTSKKRFRTKFTAEQKDKMMEFANTLGWKIQKQAEHQVKQFCDELGIKRQAFKVWMHNNNQAMRKKQS